MEELRDTKEEVCSFVWGEALAREEEEGDLGEKYAAFSRRYWGVIEKSSWG